MSSAESVVESQAMKPVSPPPAQPRGAKLVLIASCILFAFWVIAMIAMYVMMVYPQRYPKMHSKSAAGSSEIQKVWP